MFYVVYVGGEPLIVLPYQPIQGCLFGAAALVTGCGRGGCARTCCSSVSGSVRKVAVECTT